MKTTPPLSLLPLAGAMLIIATGSACAEDRQEARFAAECQEIRFQRGHDSGTVRGVAPPEDVVCFRMTARAGQTANLEVKGRNVMFAIPGVVEGQDSYSFTTENKTYRIEVGQLMRSVTDEPFSLSVTIH